MRPPIKSSLDGRSRLVPAVLDLLPPEPQAGVNMEVDQHEQEQEQAEEQKAVRNIVIIGTAAPAIRRASS